MNRDLILQTVVDGVLSASPRSFIILTPPGFEIPDFIDVIRQRLTQNAGANTRIAHVSIDTSPDDNTLIQDLVRKWTFGDDDLLREWRDECQQAQLMPPQALEAFGELTRSRSIRLIALFGRFDKAFQRISSELFASMRNLEQWSNLASVNSSPYEYATLYDQRREEAPTFTSDYGQTHSTLCLCPLTHEEAGVLWDSRLGLPRERGAEKAYFEIAYHESGGFPSVFLKAVGIASAFCKEGQQAVGFYRTELSEQLPNGFVRLFRRADGSVGSDLAEMVATIERGEVPANTVAAITGRQPWGKFLLNEKLSGIRCAAIRQAAVRCLAQSDRVIGTSTISELYRRGKYKLAVSTIECSGCHDVRLDCAARMMAMVFGDEPDRYYFPGDIDWKSVSKLAQQAAAASSGPSRTEFRYWQDVGEAHKSIGRRFERREIRDYEAALLLRTPEFVQQALICFGIRLWAVEKDRSVVTASHVALSFLEELIRHYLILVLGKRPTVSDFSEAVDSEGIRRWWPEDIYGSFAIPQGEDLACSELVLFVAVLETALPNPLFCDRKAVQQMLNGIDSRNVMGHYQSTPPEQHRKKQVDIGWDLFEKIGAATGSGISRELVAAMLKPPTAFLEDFVA